MTEPENQAEALDSELSRLIGEYLDDDAGDSTKEEAWNMIADFTVDNAKTIIAALAALPEAPAVPVVKAWQDVLAERQRQISAEGWSINHDDEHDQGEMARAAGCYALHGFFNNGKWSSTRYDIEHYLWPWSLDWWKPKDTRHNLIRAAALLLAEIERLDRMEG